MSEEVVVEIFKNEIHAKMARDVLKDEGITASVLKDDVGGIEPQLQQTGGVRLVVKAVDADRARQILRPLLSI